MLHETTLENNLYDLLENTTKPNNECLNLYTEEKDRDSNTAEQKDEESENENKSL